MAREVIGFHLPDRKVLYRQMLKRDMSYTEGLGWFGDLEGINTWEELRRRDAQNSSEHSTLA